MAQQFSQNPLEQFEPEKLPVGWPWRIFAAAFLLFFVSVLGYLGLTLGYQPYLNSQIQEKDAEIAQLSAAIPREDQEKFIQFYSQLVNLKNLLDNHVMASKLFPFLEKVSHQRVFYTNANLRIPEKQIELTGLADSFAVLAEQLESFNQAEEIERYTIQEAGLSENLVGFKVSLQLSDALLK